MIIKIIYFSVEITFLAFIFFLSTDCDQNKIIEEEKFVKIYTDIIVAEDTTSASSKSKDDIIKEVLSKHNETITDYKITIQFYNQESERWEKFFSKAIAYLEAKRQKVVK